MAKKKDERPGYGKLLDAWNPPSDAGEPIGCFATSFTFDPVFFEEQCLSRFLHLETDPDEHGSAFLIEREEKLAQVRCAAALVDQHWCRGARNPRWSLLSARVPQAILHAKVGLLVWTNRLRWITASANLTESGYRRNQEVFGCLDYYLGCEAPLAPLMEGLAFLEAALATSEPQAAEDSPAVERCWAFLRYSRGMIDAWKLEEPLPKHMPIRVVPVFTGAGRPSAIDQLQALWPNSAPAKSAHVLSPFFDPPGSSELAPAELWKLLRKRGEAEATYYVTVERATEDAAPLIRAPKALADSIPADRPSASVKFAELKLEPGRELHAKGIYLHDDRWLAYLLGSSNFTRAGLGLTGPKNLEANLVYIVDYAANDMLAATIDKAFPPSEPLDIDDTVMWQLAANEDEQTPGEFAELPPAFGAAILDLDDAENLILRLVVGTGAPAGWRAFVEADDSSVAEVPVTDEESAVRNAQEEIVVPWSGRRPPSGLWVDWNEAEGRAWWPINIASSAVLPAPDELRDLPLELLIEILMAARPLHRVMAEYLKRKGKGTSAGSGVEIDPHKKVDTSGFLLQRTRRVSAALAGLAAVLAKPVATEDSLRWRLYGPTGARAVAQAILKDADANSCGAMKGFLLAELALVLSQCEPTTAVGFLPVERIKAEIAKLTLELREQERTLDEQAPDNLRRYVADAFAKASTIAGN